MDDPHIAELWIYPVKSCRGVRVTSARLVKTGFELDRSWCVVDLDGLVVNKLESISQRKVPVLVTVGVSLTEDKAHVLLDAPGMPQFRLPTSMTSHESGQALRVECSGGSTTTGQGWSFGFEDAREYAAGSEWFTEYLNRDSGKGDGTRLHGRPGSSRFALVRSLEGLALEDFTSAGLPLIERWKSDPEYKKRVEGSYKSFADIAPLLLVNRASASFIAQQSPEALAKSDDPSAYPLNCFRGNIVVEGAGSWSEETWKRIEVCCQASTGAVTLRKIKECPRCTVPCRLQSGKAPGETVCPGKPLHLWSVLRKAFPDKNADPEWGSWAGPIFGIYFGHAGLEGATVSVGDRIRVLEICRWDDHLRRLSPRSWALLGAVALGVLALSASVLSGRPKTR
mmetsp:Transcript_44359/g.80374  ORF Transcript_44359/g.80374 Transcript_44359/m.80374 type:complete len:396 (-) Transcript_44359:45-1232(-)